MLGDLRLRPRSQWRGILTLSLSKRRLEPEAGGWLDRRQNGDDEGQGTQRRPSMYSSCGKAAIIDGALSASAIRLLKLLASGLTVLASVFLIYSMITPALSAYRYHDRSLELNLPVWTLWVVAFLGLGAMLIVAIARLIEDLQNKSSLDAGRDEAAK